MRGCQLPARTAGRGRYARSLLAREAVAEPAGHNPLGGWSVVAMLAALATQAATGLFLVQEDYAFEGPLAKHVCAPYRTASAPSTRPTST